MLNNTHNCHFSWGGERTSFVLTVGHIQTSKATAKYKLHYTPRHYFLNNLMQNKNGRGTEP